MFSILILQSFLLKARLESAKIRGYYPVRREFCNPHKSHSPAPDEVIA